MDAKKKLYILTAVLLAACAVFVLKALGQDRPREPVYYEKPVLYLYPEKETEISVTVTDKSMMSSYPAYANGWKVTAKPDGTLTSKNNREYDYLFWELDASEFEPDFSEGFCIPGKDTAAFLEEQLSYLRLTDKEQADFISYWLPRMEKNSYNLISFQFDNYRSFENLSILPEPDCFIQATMAFKALDEPVDIKEQTLPGAERYGFTAVEWAGIEIR